MGRAIITRQLAEQQSLLRELDDVTVAVLVAGLGAIALGGALVAARATFVVGLACRRQGRSPSPSRGSGCSPPVTCSGRRSRARSTRASRRRSERPVPRHARVGRRARARILEPLRADSGGPARRRAHRGVPARARRCSLRTRPAHVPRRLGADDAAPGGADPRRARRRPPGPGDGVSYVAITHLGGAGTWIAILLLAQAGPWATPPRSRPAPGCRRRSR